MADYIDRNKAINALEYNNKVFHYADSDKENIVLETVDKLCQVLCEMPAADVQPEKKGKWRHSISYNGFIVCSECKHEAYWDTDYGQQLFDYCPYCGARMKEED